MTTTREDEALSPRCVGSTGDAFCEVEVDSPTTSPGERRSGPPSNFFREAQFSGDGTTIVTHNEDQCLRTFVLPVDLLDDAEKPHSLSANCLIQSLNNVQSYALYPHFDLPNSSTTLALYSPKELPISLTNVIHSGIVHATYPLINPKTEAYIAPNSLVWTRDGTKFVAGSVEQISIFDASYDGDGPVSQHRTTTTRMEKQRYGASTLKRCTGIISALSINSAGMLAAGTFQRQVAVYANEGSGECVTSFSFGQRDSVKGSGVTQLAWSPCGTYLFVAERQSDGVQVYDMRNTFERVTWLSGREARTTQRLGIDVVPTVEGSELWAGGTDGCVRMWKNPGSCGGEQGPDETLKLHNDPISSAIWHPQGAVMATCSGRRIYETHPGEDSSSSESEDERVSPDNTLKIWTV